MILGFRILVHKCKVSIIKLWIINKVIDWLETKRDIQTTKPIWRDLKKDYVTAETNRARCH